MKNAAQIFFLVIAASVMPRTVIAQAYTSSISQSSYVVDSVYQDSCSGCSSFYRFWLNPHDPTEDVTIDCSFSRSAPHRFDLDHHITSYLQYIQTETWAEYDHVLRASSGHVAGAINLSVNGLGWGVYHVRLLGSASFAWWNETRSRSTLPVIFGSGGILTRLRFYYDESAWSNNQIEFDDSAPTVFASEGAECGSSMSAIFDPYYSRVHFECTGMPPGSVGAFVVGVDSHSLPIPLSGCVLGTDLLSVIPSGSFVMSLPATQSPILFRVQHLHIAPLASSGAMAVMASNTIRVDIH